MKNKISKILVLFSFMSFFTACDDELDELQPFVEVNPDTFLSENNVTAFQNAVDGAYGQLWQYYADSANGLQGLGDILSDNVIQAQSGRRSNNAYHDYLFVPSTAGFIANTWDEAYEAINASNIVIRNIDNLENGAGKDNILGQALGIRAWAHFDLARVYGQVPTQSAGANSTLGIFYSKFEDGDTDDLLAQPARETVGENYIEIIGDLERAAELIGASNGEGRLDRNGIYGLLSRVYLYNGEYQKAIDAADEVSTELATSEELPGVYTDSNNAGIVIELAVNTTTEANFFNVGVLYSQSSRGNIISEYVLDFDLTNSINADDIRLDVLQFDAVNGDNTYNGVKKFLGEEGQNNGRVDIKVLRAAEVLLNKAEAQFELGFEPDALATLNILRESRFVPAENRDDDPLNDVMETYTPGTETGAALEAAIQFERRVELACEGHRFFDIKRRGESIERDPDNGDLIDGTGTPPQIATIPAGNFRFQLPIPINEINANPVMAEQQNPGY
ncbi:RagB/SusD family nutrient uptake outer membrane protein [Aquimarina algicola]|uniref:RagB/SusD family nutrient uptake outer membrane protein n=1 Tax=Aquimarina algicola TaxID=2589995 RepID=A0A504ISL2_9FLAO|nr:RagB/SusD family nutrient uptake outer membrane protein [Aquimarina algicola]TPN81326.1 RagB/SusD family nutrient uptake outer membrane protein [Aquimarina algicola]